jgi:hypothetical protein
MNPTPLSNPLLRVLRASLLESKRLATHKSWYTDSPGVLAALEPLLQEVEREVAHRELEGLPGDFRYPHVAGHLMSDEEMIRRGIVPIIGRRAQFWRDDEKVLDLTGWETVAVRVLYGSSAEVIDFSFLGRGTREMLFVLWNKAEAELNRRGTPVEFLRDMNLGGGLNIKMLVGDQG